MAEDVPARPAAVEAGVNTMPMPVSRTTAIMALVALVAFVTTLDTTIVAAAAPSIGRDLGLGVGSLQWISVSYLLPYATLLLAAGALIEGLGGRRALLSGCAVFAVACVAGGVARSPELLFGARVTQGIAAAVIVPGVLSLIRTELPPPRRPIAIGVWTGALATAMALGPWFGGALAEHLHWSWIFLSNLPFLGGALALLAYAVPPDPVRPAAPPRRLLRGVPVALARLLRANRIFVGANALVVLWGLGVSGIVFFTPLLYQEFLGMGPEAAGLPLVVVAGAVLATTPFVPAVTRALGPHRAVCLGLLVLAAGLVQLAAVNGETTLGPRLAGLVLAGVGSAFTAPITGHALDQVAADDSATAASLLTASREFSGALGVALIGAVLTFVRSDEIAAGVAGGPALASGYAAGLLVAAALQVVAAALALHVLRPGRVPAAVAVQGSEET